MRRLVDVNHRSRHDVAWYAGRIGCSTRTLTRATCAVAGIAAKRLIVERIMLEAQRELVHAAGSGQHVADSSGFDEPGRFGKFSDARPE